MYRSMLARAASALVGATFVSTLLSGIATAYPSNAGAVYVETNAAAGNTIAVFSRAPNGTIIPVSSFATRGKGTGAGLGSQGAVVLSPDGAHLFAVNAGSGTITSFEVSDNGLALSVADVVASNGLMPIGLTLHGNLLYVLNSMGLGSIAGFRVATDGTLTAIPGAKQHLSQPLSNPAQVAFNPAGDVLMVTEKGTQRLDTYAVDSQGRPGPITVSKSAGLEPFGFEFDPNGHAIVSEAFAGGPGRGAVSSYQVSADGANVISPSVGDQQTAACWISITPDGKYAYTTNTASDNISSYSIGGDGSLSLLEPIAARTGKGSGPTDMDIDAGAEYLYALAPKLGVVRGFTVESNGGLTKLTSAGSLPPSASGIASR